MDIMDISDELQQHFKNVIQAVDQQEPETATVKLLNTLVEKIRPRFQFAELNEGNLREKLWSALYKIAEGTNDVQLLSCIFEIIRILSREKKFLIDLFSDNWLSIFEDNIRLKNNDLITQNKVVEVEKALCNLTFNCHDIAKKCSDGILNTLVERISSCRLASVHKEVLYFDVKLIFLITAIVSETRDLLKSRNIVEHLVGILELILKEATENVEPNFPANLSEIEVDIACETLKALFNITITCKETPEEMEECDKTVTVLKNYLLSSATSFEQTWKLKNDVINLLTNMPNACYINLLIPISDTKIVAKNLQFEEYNMICIYEILMFLKAKFNEETTISKQREVFSPVITVLLKGAIGQRAIRKFLRIHILPPLTDVHHRPEEGTTIRNHLCRLLTTPITQLRKVVAELLFVLCKKNVSRMIKYTGYGNAAGVFAEKGLLGGQRDEGEAEYSSDSEDSETEEYAEHKHGINPVLGCYEEARPSPMANMTEEQKEYEALKLVQLIDDMAKVGTIKPCTIGRDGKPKPIEHVLELQNRVNIKNIDSDSD